MSKFGIAIPLMVCTLSFALTSCIGKPPPIPLPSPDIEFDAEVATDPNAPPGIGDDPNANQNNFSGNEQFEGSQENGLENEGLQTEKVDSPEEDEVDI